jgi:hypothetical protein
MGQQGMTSWFFSPDDSGLAPPKEPLPGLSKLIVTAAFSRDILFSFLISYHLSEAARAKLLKAAYSLLVLIPVPPIFR